MPPFKLKYEDRLIAFVDILGFQDLIKRSEKNFNVISSIYKALNLFKEQESSGKWNMQLVEIEESAQKKGLQNFDISDKMNCTCFSDTIVISVKVEENNVNEMVSTLICNLASIGAVLLSDGILFRGGITIGKILHEDNGVIMGQGLICAYELESKVAKYPRIILSDTLLSRMNYPIANKREAYPYHQYIERFTDGCVGFHQLIYFQVVEPWEKMTEEKMRTELTKTKSTILKGLDHSFERPDVFQKYLWLKERYDRLKLIKQHLKADISGLDVVRHNIHYTFADENDLNCNTGGNS